MSCPNIPTVFSNAARPVQEAWGRLIGLQQPPGSPGQKKDKIFLHQKKQNYMNIVILIPKVAREKSKNFISTLYIRIYRAASSVFSSEMINTCSQLHVGSGFLKKD